MIAQCQTVAAPRESSHNGLLSALERLDHILQAAFDRAREAHGGGTMEDPFRGLYVSEVDVARTLWTRSNASCEGENSDHSFAAGTGGPAFDRISEAFELSDFDRAVMLIALAPDIAVRYERIFAYLQDDVTRRRPTVDLVLELLCPSPEERLKRRHHFGSEAPLVTHGLLQLMADPNHVQSSFLSQYLRLDDQIVRALIGDGDLDSRLIPFGEKLQPHEVHEIDATNEHSAGLAALLRFHLRAGKPFRAYLRGREGAGKRTAARAAAAAADTVILSIDLPRMSASLIDFEAALKLVFREAWLSGAVLYFDHLDTLRTPERANQYSTLLELMSLHSGIILLGGSEPFERKPRGPAGVLVIDFSLPDHSERIDLWRRCAAEHGFDLERETAEALAGRFQLTPAQINDAMATAANESLWHNTTTRCASSETSPARTTTLLAAARAQCSQTIGAGAVRVHPKYTWDDIVLPAESLRQLKEIRHRVVSRHIVLGEWGFGRKLSLGSGVNALFAGPSGTGKTMAAEVIANDLGLDLYKMDLSGIVSKYVGETEKNLDRVFNAAESANAILFFDEADALFGKRSEVRDSHDRYANIEIAYLLQKMEQYEGVAILATNIRQNIDEAFLRRLAYIVDFPFPDVLERQRLWQVLLPASAPREDDIDPGFLASQFRLSGGNIRNIVLDAAFLAAAGGGRINMKHLVRATWRENQKLGRVLTPADFGKYAGVLE